MPVTEEKTGTEEKTATYQIKDGNWSKVGNIGSAAYALCLPFPALRPLFPLSVEGQDGVEIQEIRMERWCTDRSPGKRTRAGHAVNGRESQ